MTSHAFLACAGVAVAVLGAWQPAEAQSRPCAERAVVIERLETRLGQTRQSMGFNRANGVVEVFASDETGTWTILVTTPTGQSCLIASGEMWEPNAEFLGKAGEDA